MIQKFLFALLGATALSASALAAPEYQHIVVVMEENHDLSQFTSATNAPFINGTLIPQGTLLTGSLAIGHPSQPNYLQLFSGSAQGTQGSDNPFPGQLAPPGAPFTGTGLNQPNLGASMIAAGKSFAGYSQDLHLASNPLDYVAGGLGGSLYQRIHNPWSDFISSVGGTYTLPASTNQDLSAFQSLAGNYAALPTLSFIIPNKCNDAHGDGTDCPNDSVNIGAADTFLANNLASYETWAKTHDSLLIVTTDEGNTTVGTDPATGLPLTNVLTVLDGAGIPAGLRYNKPINEYGLCAFIATNEQVAAPANCGAPNALAQAAGLNAALPEPASLAVLGVGLAGLAGLRLRRRA